MVPALTPPCSQAPGWGAGGPGPPAPRGFADLPWSVQTGSRPGSLAPETPPGAVRGLPTSVAMRVREGRAQSRNSRREPGWGSLWDAPGPLAQL